MRKNLKYGVFALSSLLFFSCEKDEKREASFVDATSMVTMDGARVFISLDGPVSNTNIDQIELQVSKTNGFVSYNSYKSNNDNCFVLDDLDAATVYYYRFSFSNLSDKLFGVVNQFVTNQLLTDVVAETYLVNGVTFKMVKVEGGSFTMGNASNRYGEGDSDEKNGHNVKLNTYYMGQTEVTQELWKAVMGSNPSFFDGPSLPVESISYDDCLAFIAKLNALVNMNFRLPTEAEWEYAAQGGKYKSNYTYSGSSNAFDVAWFYSNSAETTHPVAQKIANRLGLYDMSGNVMEWCSDWYGTYEMKDLENPQGPASGTYRVLRGGSWAHDAIDARVKNRDAYEPKCLYNDFGFRLVLADTNNGGNENGGNTNSLPANPIVVKQSGDFTISMNGENGVAVPGEEVSISFDRFPTNLADFQRTYDELKLTMGGVIVGNLMAYHLYYYDSAVGTAAIKLCNYENNVNSTISQLSQKFSKSKINDSYCQPFLVASYLEGASPLNAYHPTKPYTVKLRMHPSDARAPQTGGFSFTGVDYTIQIWCNGVKNEDGTYGTWRNVEVLAKKGIKDFTMFNCPSLYTQVAPISFLADPEIFEELK